MKISQGQNRHEHLSLPGLCILDLGISRSVSIAPEIARIMFSSPFLTMQNHLSGNVLDLTPEPNDRNRRDELL